VRQRDGQVLGAITDALELMLRSDSDTEREFAVTVCLGFFVFRDAI
jgi:hypothetical protein